MRKPTNRKSLAKAKNKIQLTHEKLLSLRKNKKLINEIEKINKRYHFRKDFDLLGILITDIGMLLATKEKPRDKAINKNLKELAAKVRELRKLLSEAEYYVKILIYKARDKYNVLDSENKPKLKMSNNSWCIDQLNDDLSILLDLCTTASKKIPEDKGGVKPKLLSSKAIIYKLARIYHDGTSNNPTCGRDSINDIYCGTFFNFLFDMQPLLKKFNIELGAPETIGKNAISVLKRYHDFCDSLSNVECQNKETMSMVVE